MRRIRIDLEAISCLDNLAHAAYLAARGKKARGTVQAFFADLPGNLSRLGEAIRAGRLPIGHFSRFTVHDPKPRIPVAHGFSASEVRPSCSRARRGDE